MSRIGQILIREGLATESSVARALGVQQFAGGRVGTLLLERGSVSEDELGTALAGQHGCEYISWRVLGDVPPPTLASLPAKFAVRHAAIPYELGEGYLKLALRDPGDLRVLDELFFVTGRKVIPAVAPEVRIYQALEKYYGERRTPRFAILAEKLSRPSTRTGPKPVPPPPSFFPEPPLQEPVRSPLPHEVWGGAGAPETSEPPIIQTWKITDAPPVTWGAAPAGRSAPESQEESISWEETPSAPATPREMTSSESVWLSEPAPDSTRDERAAGAEPEERPPLELPPPAGVPAPSDFPEVLAARDRDTIAAAVLAAMARRFQRSAVFAAKHESVSGWEASGRETSRSALRRVEIPWTEPSIFLNVRLSRSFYLGPLPPLPRHQAIADAMGGPAEECVVQPVLIREKPVAFLYAEFPRERGAKPIDLAYLRELAGAAASAFAASIRLKKKEVV